MGEAPQIKPLGIAAYAAEPLIGADCAGRLAVEQLIYSYSYVWDSREAQATASLFTQDAKLDFYVNGANEPTQQTVGRESILEGMSARTRTLMRWQVETRHLMLNTVFGPTEDGAIQAMTTSVIYWQQLPAHPQPAGYSNGGTPTSQASSTPESYTTSRRWRHPSERDRCSNGKKIGPRFPPRPDRQQGDPGTLGEGIPFAVRGQPSALAGVGH